MQNMFDDFVVLSKSVISFPELWVNFHQIARIIGHNFSDMCRNLGPNLVTKMARPRPKIGLVTSESDG